MSDIIDDFRRRFGERPAKRTKKELIEELNRAERKVKDIKSIIDACDNYESLWEGYITGNERGKRER